MTSPRLSIQKSISISGILIRSGFRNLSNNKLCLIGSISVIPSAYETKLPAAEPLPGPTGIFLFFAYLTKSAVIKKYPANPMFFMTFSS